MESLAGPRADSATWSRRADVPAASIAGLRCHHELRLVAFMAKPTLTLSDPVGR